MAIQKNTPNLLKKLGLPFTPIINSTMDLIKDPAALGIYIYLQSKPQNWTIREKNLMERFGKGRDFVRARLKDLRDAGLLVSKSNRDKGGKIIGWTTYLYSHIESQANNQQQDEEPPAEEQAQEKKAAKPEAREAQKKVKTRALVNPTHSNKRGLSLVKKETTTTVEEVFVSETIDEELMRLRNEHMDADNREPEEFIKQCKWHLDNGDTKKYNFSQRIAGLKKLIRQKRFETPATYPAKKKTQVVSERLMWSQYQNYINSPVEQDLRAKGIAKEMSFEDWKKQG